MKARTGNAGDPKFTHAFITASLTFTVGAMGVLGSIQDGLTGNYQTLLLKGILDGIIVMVMVSSMGKGALFSFIPVGITQWLITAMAHIAAPLMTPSAIDNLSYVGSILISALVSTSSGLAKYVLQTFCQPSSWQWDLHFCYN